MENEQIREMIRQELQQMLQNMSFEELLKLLGSDRYIFTKHIQVLDGKHIQVGRGSGLKIGTASDQKLSVFGVTPVIQSVAIAAPSGGVTIDSQARTTISSLITVLKNFGITA